MTSFSLFSFFTFFTDLITNLELRSFLFLSLYSSNVSIVLSSSFTPFVNPQPSQNLASAMNLAPRPAQNMPSSSCMNWRKEWRRKCAGNVLLTNARGLWKCARNPFGFSVCRVHFFICSDHFSIVCSIFFYFQSSFFCLQHVFYVQRSLFFFCSHSFLFAAFLFLCSEYLVGHRTFYSFLL